ncbi:MAG: carbohydrate kinase family protein [Candidatus Vogelbacteria bacterium]|nr:carbohydrate kinase family protein [Candidatus Vogelbacteria bacterium]
MEYDFIAIGDLATDAFIRLKDAEVHCDVSHEHCQICLKFADKIPYESVTVVPAVGNSPNAAAGAARLGLKTALVTNIGADLHGKEALTALEKNGVDNKFVTTHEGQPTNYHYVLWYEADRTILVKHEPFDYKLPELGKPKWIYLSSMGQSSEAFHDEIASYLENNPEIKLAFQPGTFQIALGTTRLARIYKRTEIFFCNVEEAKRILKTDEPDVKILLEQINKLGPKIIVITDGPAGASARDEAGVVWQMPIYPDPKPPLERTGAGDAFASTVVSALALGEPLEKALAWGPINSMSVVQSVGAQQGLLTREQLEKYLAEAPIDYQAKKIT